MNHWMYRTYYIDTDSLARDFDDSEVEIPTQIWRVPVPRNSTGMGVAPRSEAMEKYEIAVVARMMTASWWKSRVPLGLYRIVLAHISDTVAGSADHEVKANHDEQRQCEDAEDCPQPVRTMGGEVVVGIGWVEVKRVVGHCD